MAPNAADGVAPKEWVLDGPGYFFFCPNSC